MDDNIVLQFFAENVSLDSNSITISNIRLISPDVLIIRTPDDEMIDGFRILSQYDESVLFYVKQRSVFFIKNAKEKVRDQI